jgi:alkylhydroperoxidase family enzyme
MTIDIIPAGPGEQRERLLSLAPELGEALETFSADVSALTRLPIDVREGARFRIAQINGCAICLDTRPEDIDAAGVGGSFYDDIEDPDRRSRLDPRVRAAVEFAERFARGAEAFDDTFWAALRSLLDDTEIVDLAVVVSKYLAIGRFNAVFALEVSCPVRTPVPSDRVITE